MTGVPKALVQGDGDEGSTVEWQTPEALFDALDKEFGPFTMDPATALGYHTSRVIVGRLGKIVTLDGSYQGRMGGQCDDPPYHRPEQNDGLAAEWTGRVYLNHPYGRADWRWMKKARDSVREGDADIVVALVPVKTGMRWWQLYIGSGYERLRDSYRPQNRITWAKLTEHKDGAADIVRFLHGRQRFGGATSSAPFNSAVIVWRK